MQIGNVLKEIRILNKFYTFELSHSTPIDTNTDISCALIAPHQGNIA